MMLNGDGKQDMKKPLGLLALLIIILFVIELVYLDQFNSQQRTLTSYLESNNVSGIIRGRGGATDSWIKRDVDINGQRMDLKGKIYDVELNNDSGFQIEGWAMRLNIEADCWLNQAWCGTVEIHQDVEKGERVQTLDLRNVVLGQLNLEYFYAGDILIPLHRGDYILYRPSFQEGEMPVEAEKSIKAGLIMYYPLVAPEPDFDAYTMDYNFHRTILDGDNIYLLGGLAIIWLLMLMTHIFSNIAYKRAMKEMSLRRSGIMSMSELYAMIYIMDIGKKELSPIVEDEEAEAMRPKKASLQEQLAVMVDGGCTEEYKEAANSFCDLGTLDQRLADKNTIILEYISRLYGWCQARFLVMERGHDGQLEKVLLTVQIIDAEKKEMERVASKVTQAKQESRAKSTFLANMSHEIRTPINTIIGLNTMIIRESRDPVVSSYAKSVHTAAHMLLSVINSVLDMSKIEAGKMELQPEEYSLKAMLRDIYTIHSSRAEFEQLDFSCRVTPSLPDRLCGDAVRIKQVVINLLANAVKFTEKGSIRLSVYGKVHDERRVHLLFSVKDTGIGIREEDLHLLAQRFVEFDARQSNALDGTGIGLNLSNSILAMMGSELHVVSRYGQGSEFYFEIEQDVVEPAPIGDVDFVAEEAIVLDDYQALFQAPEAKILVIDDNAMDRVVFEELLKETGIQVDTAASGMAALEKTRECRYDIIFVDQVMPAMNGAEVLDAIKQQEDGLNKNAVAILLSANSIEDVDDMWYEAAADFAEFIAKPIQPDLLERKLLQYLPPEKVTENTAVVSGRRADGERLPNISGVDVAFGLNHTGGMRGYHSVLEQFVRTGREDAEELGAYIEALTEHPEDGEAMSSFRIRIRAMKASLHMMGALRAYGVAAMLENAAVHSNRQEVVDVAPYLLKEWERLRQAVEAALAEGRI